jgi:hypothetical protein
LLWTFDIALAEGDGGEEFDGRWDWGKQRTFIFWDKKPLNVVLKQVDGRVSL